MPGCAAKPCRSLSGGVISAALLSRYSFLSRTGDFSCRPDVFDSCKRCIFVPRWNAVGLLRTLALTSEKLPDDVFLPDPDAHDESVSAEPFTCFTTKKILPESRICEADKDSACTMFRTFPDEALLEAD